MILYRNHNGRLEPAKESPFKIERELQRLFEQNLMQIMGFELVKSEFSIKNKRIDTLAYDPESNAFIIIEYKRERNASVVDQGMTYLSLMLQNKADFVLEYNEQNPKNQLARSQVDWSQSRVVFVASDFTDNQIEATNFKDIAIELYEVKRYDEHLLVVPIKKSKSAVSIKPITQKNEEYKNVAAEIKVYTEEDFLAGKSEEVVALYERYRSAILALADDIEIKPQKWYIAFKKGQRNICDIEIQSAGFKMSVNVKRGELDDPKGIMRDVSVMGHRGNGDYEIKIFDDKNLEYIMSVVRQAIGR
jgi:predicted transport protein